MKRLFISLAVLIVVLLFLTHIPPNRFIFFHWMDNHQQDIECKFENACPEEIMDWRDIKLRYETCAIYGVWIPNRIKFGIPVGCMNI